MLLLIAFFCCLTDNPLLAALFIAAACIDGVKDPGVVLGMAFIGALLAIGDATPSLTFSSWMLFLHYFLHDSKKPYVSLWHGFRKPLGSPQPASKH